MSEPRVTARIIRTEAGHHYTEYRVNGVSYPSAEAVQTALNTSVTHA